MEKVVELAPNEPNSYDLLGDAYRAQNNLTGARDAYTRAHKLDPDEALPEVDLSDAEQRGAVCREAARRMITER